jgi:hypothetical protein
LLPPKGSGLQTFAVGIGAYQLGHVPDGRGLGLDLSALGAQGGALGLEVGKGRTLTLALAGKLGTGFAHWARRSRGNWGKAFR